MGSEAVSGGLSVPGEVDEALARAAGRLGPFSHRLCWHEQVASTNDVAMAAADGGAPEGFVVAANAQSAGRGRRGRSWASPPGAGLYVSAILRPPPQVLQLITISAGVALAEGIEAAAGVSPCVKWPNDVYGGSRKPSGSPAENG